MELCSIPYGAMLWRVWSNAPLPLEHSLCRSKALFLLSESDVLSLRKYCSSCLKVLHYDSKNSLSLQVKKYKYQTFFIAIGFISEKMIKFAG